MHRLVASRGPSLLGPAFLAGLAVALSACGDQKIVAVGGGPYDTTADSSTIEETSEPQRTGR